MRVTTQVSTQISLDTRDELEALDVVACMSEMIPEEEYTKRGYDKAKVEKLMEKLHELLKSALKI
jgi:hypothetical protein